jgi:hypothetical protein
LTARPFASFRTLIENNGSSYLVPPPKTAKTGAGMGWFGQGRQAQITRSGTLSRASS